ncbi:S-formylglutathione hydrolase [Chionoecetes opilio]|uniref:S-formylglutathione hydrolase n=1 Tax=Chionoecetes opilio TaxID=41210 RepID=A0A8J5CZX4_CHIOP|nr:S-formylglutathione hydrolase [Chionoecetes opilio]
MASNPISLSFTSGSRLSQVFQHLQHLPCLSVLSVHHNKCLKTTGGCNIDGEEDSWDFGSGAGFYVDATEEKWKKITVCSPTSPKNCLPSLLRTLTWQVTGSYHGTQPRVHKLLELLNSCTSKAWLRGKESIPPADVDADKLTLVVPSTAAGL